MRFRLRTLLLLFAFVAVLLALVPQYLRYHRWRGTKQQLVEWSARLERKPFKNETFVKMTLDLPSGSSISYFVSTTQPLREVDSNGVESWTTTEETSRTPDPNRYFVVPPGKWVETIDDVILAWDNHRSSAIKQ